MKLSIKTFLILLLAFCSAMACKKAGVDTGDENLTDTTPRRVADPNTQFDESKFDDVNWPEMREWKKAGKPIPWYSSTPIKKTISATNSAGLQAAIDEVAAAGGGQLKLNNGTYIIDATVLMKNNVRLCGSGNSGSNPTRLIITIRAIVSAATAAIQFTNVRNAGIDNLLIEYDGEGTTPNHASFTDAFPNFNVTSIYMHGGTNNCWLQGLRIINSGTGTINLFNTSYVSVRDCYIDGAFNKGGGNGYFNITGQYNLVFNNTIKNIRHLSLKNLTCQYNVVYKNTINVDVNFHDGDAGHNLIEGNDISLPQAHPWNALQGGDPAQHKGPGPGNIIWANNVYNPDATPTNQFTSSTLYWLTVGEATNFNFYPSNTTYPGATPYKKNLPPGNTFYPVL
jgi:hypothetical protein